MFHCRAGTVPVQAIGLKQASFGDLADLFFLTGFLFGKITDIVDEFSEITFMRLSSSLSSHFKLIYYTIININ